MIDFAAARRMMVDGQVRTADVTDPGLLAAMLDVPRERFVPEDKLSLSYLDLDLSVGEDGRPVRRWLKPMVLAKLIQAAEVTASDRVLDIGCASGYSTALLARLAGSVVGLEEDSLLARQAAEAFAELGVVNVKVVTGPLAGGWPREGRFDLILLQGATEIVPNGLLDQLNDRGRLVCILGAGPAAKAMMYRLIAGELSGRAIFDAAASLLPGFAKPPAFVF